jgi:hypothetical protein
MCDKFLYTRLLTDCLYILGTMKNAMNKGVQISLWSNIFCIYDQTLKPYSSLNSSCVQSLKYAPIIFTLYSHRQFLSFDFSQHPQYLLTFW